MTSKLTVELTDELIDEIDEQIDPSNEVVSIDCLALNPDIAEQVNGDRRGSSYYILFIYQITLQGKEVFLLLFDDGEGESIEDFEGRAHFYETEADARAAMGAEYNDWLTRF